MGQFLTPLELEELSQDRWKLLNPLIYKTNSPTVLGEYITVPAGFETDLESIPRWLPITYATLYGSAHPASVLHDWLYSTGKLDRKTADGILYEAILARGEPGWKAWAIWLGVRMGGWVAWNAHRKEDT